MTVTRRHGNPGLLGGVDQAQLLLLVALGLGAYYLITRSGRPIVISGEFTNAAATFA